MKINDLILILGSQSSTHPNSCKSGCFLPDQEEDRVSNRVMLGENDVGGGVQVSAPWSSSGAVVVDIEMYVAVSRLAGHHQESVGCHQLESGVDSSLQLGFPV